MDMILQLKQSELINFHIVINVRGHYNYSTLQNSHKKPILPVPPPKKPR